jgi:hypothetical protein
LRICVFVVLLISTLRLVISILQGLLTTASALHPQFVSVNGIYPTTGMAAQQTGDVPLDAVSLNAVLHWLITANVADHVHELATNAKFRRELRTAREQIMGEEAAAEMLWVHPAWHGRDVHASIFFHVVRPPPGPNALRPEDGDDVGPTAAPHGGATWTKIDAGTMPPAQFVP